MYRGAYIVFNNIFTIIFTTLFLLHRPQLIGVEHEGMYNENCEILNNTTNGILNYIFF